jgi:hypothetical protein
MRFTIPGLPDGSRLQGEVLFKIQLINKLEKQKGLFLSIQPAWEALDKSKLFTARNFTTYEKIYDKSLFVLNPDSDSI